MIARRSLVKIIASFSFLAAAVWFMDWRQVATSMRTVSPTVFLSIVGLCVAGIMIMSLRWWYMIKGYLRIGLIRSTIFYAYATFLNLFSPANLAGDAFRVFALGRLGAPQGQVIVEILRERVIGLLTYATGYLVFLMIDERRETAPSIFVFIGWLAILGIAALLAAPVLASWLLQNVSAIERRPRIVLIIRRSIGVFRFHSLIELMYLMLTSYVALLGWITNFWILAHILGLHVSSERIAMAVILTEIIRIVPFTIQGIGIRESAFTYFIGLAGGVVEIGFAVVSIAYIALTCGQLVCGFANIRIGSGTSPQGPKASPNRISS